MKEKVEKLERDKAAIERMQQIPLKGQRRQIDTENTDNEHPELEGEELINYLETKLEQIEKNLIESQREYEKMQNECLDIQERLGFSKEKYKRAALLLTEFLEDFLKQKPNILRDATASKESLDEAEFDRLCQTPFDDLTREEKVNIVFLLLR